MRQPCVRSETATVRTLHHGGPGGLGVRERSLAAQSDDLAVLDEAADEVVQRERVDSRVGVDHQEVLVEGRVDADDVLDLVEDLELGGSHRRIEVDAVEEAHEEHLRVALAAVAGTVALGRLADLDDHDVGNDVTARLVQSRVHLGHVVLLVAVSD